jgi:integrase
MGRRNYAILLLLSRLGLRAVEIAGLNLEEIDWDNALITVWGKCRQRAQLLLPADVGQAVAQYLHGDRPRYSSRSVFIRDHAPIAGFGQSHAISKIVWCALEKAGVKSARKGAHLLRHGLAPFLCRTGEHPRKRELRARCGVKRDYAACGIINNCVLNVEGGNRISYFWELLSKILWFRDRIRVSSRHGAPRPGNRQT